MMLDRASLYDRPGLIFEAEGSTWLKLTPCAAISACATAAEHGVVVVRVEGGIWHFPGFEPRGDCIWDGIDPPCTADEAQKNNESAVRFIATEKERHGAFILTTAPIGGYEHARVRHAI